jgi:hypothetical protein
MNIKFDKKTILTIGGVVLGIYLIKKISEKNNPSTLVVSSDEDNSSFANYVDEDFMGYVDEGFMGMGGDEFMKFGGGKPIAFASANGTDNAIYEPNFFNSDGKVPIATDEPNFANSNGNENPFGKQPPKPPLPSPKEPITPNQKPIFGKRRLNKGGAKKGFGIAFPQGYKPLDNTKGRVPYRKPRF